MWFVIRNEVLNFPDWILCYHELFHDKVKTHSNISLDLYLWNLNHMKFISHEYGNGHYFGYELSGWGCELSCSHLCSFCSFILSFFFCVLCKQALCNLRNTLFNFWLIYFSQLSDYLKYIAFYEALALLDQLKK